MLPHLKVYLMQHDILWAEVWGGILYVARFALYGIRPTYLFLSSTEN